MFKILSYQVARFDLIEPSPFNHNGRILLDVYFDYSVQTEDSTHVESGVETLDIEWGDDASSYVMHVPSHSKNLQVPIDLLLNCEAKTVSQVLDFLVRNLPAQDVTSDHT